jgi:hypothetical protein
MPSRTYAVSFGSWTHVTMASSLFEACRNAWEWFNDPFWEGAHPTPDTVFTVRVVGSEPAVYRVRGRPFLVPNRAPSKILTLLVAH